MHDYNDEYFFIVKNENNPKLPALTPDKNTVDRRYYYVPPPAGSAPFIFTNGWKDEFRADGIKDEVADISFSGANFMVRDYIREQLIVLNLPELTIHPSIYIDDAGNWHEDFWFITFHDEFDCWDRQRSIYEPHSPRRSMVFEYVLDSTVLVSTPLERRTLFQMGATLESRVMCHHSIAAIFRKNGNSGAVLKPVADYR